MGLDELRAYRADLIDEEAKVSYWRRLVQARLDVVRAVADSSASVAQLGALLSSPVVPSGRTSLLQVVAADDIPLLPDLATLWRQQPRPDDEAATARLEHALAEAEELLSEYRAAVLQRLESATAELIARYHDEPTACLVALPLR